MVFSVVALACSEAFSKSIRIDQLPEDSELIGMSKPLHVEVLGLAWTPELAVYDVPLGPDAVRVQVPDDVTVCISVRICRTPALTFAAVISIPTPDFEEPLAGGVGAGLGSLPVAPFADCCFAASPEAVCSGVGGL